MRAKQTSRDVSKVRQALFGLGEVRLPEEAEEPILAPNARAAVFGWLLEINAAEELKRVKVKPRSTGLMVGPPGCGKTTLAHHLAARLGIPMVSVGAEHLLGAYLGESEKKTALLFSALAELETRCVLFLDEIDAIGGKRDMNRGGGADNARTSMLTVLLRKIEAFDGILVAATNRGEDLDPALWRRFGMQITIDLPLDDERFAILKRYAAPYEFAEPLLERLTEMTDGASPALLRQLVEGLKRYLVLAQRLRLDPSDLRAAIAAVIGQVKPHPDYAPPHLWADKSALRSLDDLPWPPARLP